MLACVYICIDVCVHVIYMYIIPCCKFIQVSMSVAELEQSTDQVVFFLHYWTFGCIVQIGRDDVSVRL